MNAARLTTPGEKARQLQRKLYLAAKANSKRRFHALYDKVYREEILWEAWRRVKANEGAAGVDGQTIEQVKAYGEERFVQEIQAKLQQGRYRPQPVRRTYIPKNEKEKRPLGIPAVKDRVVQMATKIVIEPIFEADFLECSFGFRPRRDAHQALERIRKACNNGGWWVVDLDIRKYFDTINHEKLMLLVQRRISDRRVLKLLRQWLRAGIMEEGKYMPSEIGSPQGGVISPLLANIYLHYLDYNWTKNYSHLGVLHAANSGTTMDKNGIFGGVLTRYADDAVVVCRSYKNGQRTLKVIRAVMQTLELEIHPEKTRLVNLWDGREGFDFLGFHHRRAKAQAKNGRGYYTTQQWPSAKAMKKMRQKVREKLAPGEKLCKTAQSLVKELNPVIRGWRNYYGLPYARRKLGQIDWYILVRFTKWLNRKRQRQGRLQRMGEAYQLCKTLGLERAAAYPKAAG